VRVHPGDLVVADGDGVVVIPKAHAAEVVAAATQRMQKEEQAIAAIHNGASPWSLGAERFYAALDVQEVDGAYEDHE